MLSTKGIHKHFRMIAISEFMKSQGYAPSHAEHTRIPGIWKKLSTLYNLPALDERVSYGERSTVFVWFVVPVSLMICFVDITGRFIDNRYR